MENNCFVHATPIERQTLAIQRHVPPDAVGFRFLSRVRDLLERPAAEWA